MATEWPQTRRTGLADALRGAREMADQHYGIWSWIATVIDVVNHFRIKRRRHWELLEHKAACAESVNEARAKLIYLIERSERILNDAADRQEDAG